KVYNLYMRLLLATQARVVTPRKRDTTFQRKNLSPALDVSTPQPLACDRAPQCARDDRCEHTPVRKVEPDDCVAATEHELLVRSTGAEVAVVRPSRLARRLVKDGQTFGLRSALPLRTRHHDSVPVDVTQPK